MTLDQIAALDTSAIAAEFYVHAARDDEKWREEKTKPEGMRIRHTTERLMVKLTVRGRVNDYRSHIVFEGQEDHWAAKYPVEWENFQTGANEIGGMPLDALGTLSLATKATLMNTGIKTVEQLAELDDEISRRIAAGPDAKKDAIAFLAAKKLQDEGDTVATIESLRARIEELEAEKKPATRRKASTEAAA